MSRTGINRFIVIGGVRVFPRQIILIPIVVAVIFFLANLVLRFTTTRVGIWTIHIADLHNRENAQACLQPEIDPTALPPELMPPIPEPLDCQQNDADWLAVDDEGSIGFHPDAKNVVNQMTGQDVDCDILPVLRDGDDSIKYADSLGHLVSSNLEGKIAIKVETFTVLAKCKATKAITIGKTSSSEQNRVYFSIVPQKSIRDKAKAQWKSNKKAYNVIILMIDSLSRAAWERYIKTTVDYFTKDLGATVFEGFNIVGDGTPQNMFPFLMGLSEFEMPESRRFQPGAKPLDDLPWLYKTYGENGYVTLAAEDMPMFSMYNYRFLGFDKPPADYYSRPFYLTHAKNLPVWQSLGLFRDFCFGTRAKHSMPLDWVLQLFRVYSDVPKMAFLTFGELTHDDNAKAKWADSDVAALLKSLKENNYLDDTFFVLLSDHGARYDNLRATLQGKLEERLPFVGMYVPPKFKAEYPEQTRILTEVNRKRLSTPYDMHLTFVELLKMTSGKDDVERTSVTPVPNRAQSLFHEVPLSRTCENAKIESHWCACIAWINVAKDDSIAIRAAEHVLSYLATITAPVADLCAKLTLGSIISAERLAPNDDLLRFRQTNDRDGYRADMSDSMVSAQVIYQVTFEALPSHGKFFATITYWPRNGYFTFDGEKALSRLDRYGRQPWCIVESHPQIRPYCYCKEQKEGSR